MADYRVELPSAEALMVRANNKAQAIRFATHKLVKIEILTTEEAIKLAKAGQELLDATGEPEADAGAPLLEMKPSFKVGDSVIPNGPDGCELAGVRSTIQAIDIDGGKAVVGATVDGAEVTAEVLVGCLTFAPDEEQEEPQKPKGGRGNKQG